MPSWLIALIVGFFGGLGTLLLRLPHERAVELRSRMLEATDDFVAAFTTAREATSSANQTVGSIESFADKDVPPELRREWLAERKSTIETACVAWYESHPQERPAMESVPTADHRWRHAARP